VLLLNLKVPGENSRNVTLTVVVAWAWSIAKSIAPIEKGFQIVDNFRAPWTKAWGRLLAMRRAESLRRRKKIVKNVK
jgi:hypothetical protein